VAAVARRQTAVMVHHPCPQGTARRPRGTETPDSLIVELGRPANPAFANFQKDGSLPRTLSELRACSFYESRRPRFKGGPAGLNPDEKYLPYSLALVESIHCTGARADRTGSPPRGR
jgi:hypothetical protein